MTDLVWLASYPKSGNTWFRMMLRALVAEGAVDINDLSSRGSHAASREMLEALTLADSGVLTSAEIDALRPSVYQWVAKGAYPKAQVFPGVAILKVHDAYGNAPDGRPLFASGAKAILIVRDPRDVASARAHVECATIDAAIEAMGDPDHALCTLPDRQELQLRQRLGSWSGHAESWLRQADVPVHVVRYEDMQRDAAGVLARAAIFAGLPITAADALRAAQAADFATAQAQERAHGFIEHAAAPGRMFFRRGLSGGWRDELTPSQVRRLELQHGPTMRKLGYEPSYEARDASRLGQRTGGAS